MPLIYLLIAQLQTQTSPLSHLLHFPGLLHGPVLAVLVRRYIMFIFSLWPYQGVCQDLFSPGSQRNMSHGSPCHLLLSMPQSMRRHQSPHSRYVLQPRAILAAPSLVCFFFFLSEFLMTTNTKMKVIFIIHTFIISNCNCNQNVRAG